MFYPRYTTTIVTSLVITVGGFSYVVLANKSEINNIAQQITVKITNDYSGGSGVIVKRDGNVYSVLTNWHVVPDETDYYIQTNDNLEHKVIQKNKVDNMDLAIVTFESNNEYQLATLGDSDELNLTDTVYVAGFPIKNNNIDLTVGNIRTIKEDVIKNPQSKEGYALIYSNSVFTGMSGGAVIDEQGRVIAINGQHQRDPETFNTIALGIPINLFKKEFPDIAQQSSNKANNNSFNYVLAHTTLNNRTYNADFNSLVVSGNKIFSGSKNNTIEILNLDTGNLEQTLSGHSRLVTSIAIHGDKIVGGSHDPTINVWNLKTGQLEHILKGHRTNIYSVATDGDKIISGGYGSRIKVWNLNTGNLERTIERTGRINSLAIDGDKIISGSWNRTIKVWNLNTGNLIRTLSGHSGRVNSVAIYGDKIVSGSDDATIKVWNINTGKIEQNITGHGKPVNSVAIDGNKIVSGSRDETIKIWNLNTGELEKTLYNHSNPSPVTSVRIYQDKIISGSQNGIVKIWQLQN